MKDRKEIEELDYLINWETIEKRLEQRFKTMTYFRPSLLVWFDFGNKCIRRVGSIITTTKGEPLRPLWKRLSSTPLVYNTTQAWLCRGSISDTTQAAPLPIMPEERCRTSRILIVRLVQCAKNTRMFLYIWSHVCRMKSPIECMLHIICVYISICIIIA